MTELVCATPLSWNDLTDCWLGELPAEAEGPVEEHLFGCAACSRRLERIAGLAGTIHDLARRGALRGIVTGSFVDRLSRDGLRVREYRLGPGQAVPCTVTPDDDVLIGRLGADLSGLERVDFVVCDAQGREAERWKDIPFLASTGEIIFTERMDRLRALGSVTQVVHLVSVEKESERLIGEYTFVHTPSP